MKVSQLTTELEEFQAKLVEHQHLWGASLDGTIPDFPIRNGQSLQEQSRWLSRRLGALRPYIKRFDRAWTMQHPATGVTWDALEEATGTSAVAPVKAPSLRSTIQKLDQLLGHLASLEQERKSLLIHESLCDPDQHQIE
jgi:hypothetical protein